MTCDIDCQHVYSIWACWLLVADGGPAQHWYTLLVGMGKELNPVELCSYTMACQCGSEIDMVYCAQQQQRQVGSCCLPSTFSSTMATK